MANNLGVRTGSDATVKTTDNASVHTPHQNIDSVPTDPFGANADAASATGSISAKLRTLATAVKAEDAAFQDGDTGIPALVKRSSTPAATSGADGDYEPMQSTGGRLNVRGEPRMFAAAFSTLTRPANTTAYAANDAVSNNATAGSVTAQSATVADVNDDLILVERVRVLSTDTGTAGISFRVWLFNSDPTASSGVGGGDNAAWSQKQAGFVGTMSGTFRAASDGSVAVLVPDEGARIICKPVSGAKTLYALVQTLGAFTPSANSTTFDMTAEGIQGRA